jgi:monoamine oxidase
MDRIDADVVVVGAGLAGLETARRLRASGASVVVLEARDRVGGRIVNQPIGGGQALEMGGQWIGPGQDRMYAALRDHGLGTYPTYTEGEGIASMDGRVRRFRRSPTASPAVVVDLQRLQRHLDRAAQAVPLGAPWLAPDAEDLDGQTFERWLRRHSYTRSALAWYRTFSEVLFAAEPENLSALYALFYVHSGGGVASLAETAGGAQQDRVEGGSQLLALRMAEHLGDTIRLSAPVRRLDQRGGRVVVAADGVEAAARRAVIALAPTLAARIDMNPPLPAARDQLTQRMPMGSVIKLQAVYDEPFWREDGLNGMASAADGPVGVVFDNSLPGDGRGVLVAFFEGRHAVDLGRLTVAERRATLTAELVRLFGPAAGRPVEVLERDWAAEEWSRGCYGAHLPPGVLRVFGPDLRRPIGRIHWAGTETAQRWCGYMDGAMESGERAAGEVLAALA